MKRKDLYLKMFHYENFFNDKIIRLESMDYDTKVFPMPEIYKKAINLMFQHNTLTYSDFGGFPRMIKQINLYENLVSKTSFQKAVFVSAGVSSLLNTVVKLISRKCPKKEQVVLFSPEYSFFHSVVEGNGLKPIVINTSRKNNFIPTIKQIKEKINNKTLAVIFSNPNNPTCQILPNNFIKELVNLCKKNETFIVTDEVYRNTVFDEKNYSPIEKVNGGYNNLFKLFGPSKDRPGLNGLRMGYCLFDRKFENNFKKEHVVSNFSNNIIADFLFLIDISMRNYNMTNKKSNDLKLFSNYYLDDYNKKLQINRTKQKKYLELIIREINQNRNIVDFITPTCGNSLWFKYKTALPPETFVKLFTKKGVALYASDVFLDNYKINGSWSRICITKDISKIIKGLKKI
ncbi:MAG: pyridoxal phosphate-dependent aminotransferase [Candidatus Moranbacteria bacterium]|nr:pyridoxal phosphate-dependent aminotransferase [Candidatus Moranbacteria bacterium]